VRSISGSSSPIPLFVLDGIDRFHAVWMLLLAQVFCRHFADYSSTEEERKKIFFFFVTISSVFSDSIRARFFYFSFWKISTTMCSDELTSSKLIAIIFNVSVLFLSSIQAAEKEKRSCL
jgi:hypothetical protein